MAVAWFTDEELIAELINLRFRRPSLDIQVIISNALENFRNTQNINNLIDSGCTLRIMKDECRFLHHKFCIVDGNTIITGSYNWTYYAASRNEENIVIIRTGLGEQILQKFQAKFNHYCKENQTIVWSNFFAPALLTPIASYELEEIDLRSRFQKRVLKNLKEIEEINSSKLSFDRVDVPLINSMIRQYGDGVAMVKKLVNESAQDGKGQLQPKSGFINLT